MGKSLAPIIQQLAEHGIDWCIHFPDLIPSCGSNGTACTRSNEIMSSGRECAKTIWRGIRKVPGDQAILNDEIAAFPRIGDPPAASTLKIGCGDVIRNRHII